MVELTIVNWNLPLVLSIELDVSLIITRAIIIRLRLRFELEFLIISAIIIRFLIKVDVFLIFVVVRKVTKVP